MGVVVKDSPRTAKLWYACADHKIVFQGMMCPKDPVVVQRDLTLENCPVCGHFPYIDEAQRFLVRLECQEVEAEVEQELQELEGTKR